MVILKIDVSHKSKLFTKICQVRVNFLFEATLDLNIFDTWNTEITGGSVQHARDVEIKKPRGRQPSTTSFINGWIIHAAWRKDDNYLGVQ